jgi:TfoX/Sxy family transcriptional regulator of competence genes
MAYNEALAARVRDELSGYAPFEERKMFGGLALMVNTHMACGILGDDLMVRVGKLGHQAAIADGAREMDFTGRPMRGLVMVGAPLLTDEAVLARWVQRAAEFALSDPPKSAKR